MKLIKEEESRELIQEIEFESKEEKKTIIKQMVKDGWEDLDPYNDSLIVRLRKYIDIR